MAKRFTDTNKYKKPFIRSLPAGYKLLWDFLYHDCDHAGIWIVDFQIAQAYVGVDAPIERAEALTLFNAEEIKIVELDKGKKWFIPSFIEFQYGKLSEKNKAHINVISVLKKFNLLNTDFSIKDLGSPLEGAKEKEKEKEMEKDNDEGVGEEKTFQTFPAEESLNLDLPAVKVGAVQELMKITKNISVSPEQVISFWKVFKAQNFTGKKYYADVGAITSHFINWMKTQNVNNGASSNQANKSHRQRQSDAQQATLEALAGDIGVVT